MTNNLSILVSLTAAHLKTELSKAEAGHDWWHTYRVWQNAKTIALGEPVNGLVVELGALLHDIADSKFYDGNEEVGPQAALEFLNKIQAPAEITTHVVQIVRHISFKGGNEKLTWTSPELQVVQDADRLDAIGAIGIARAFSYGGYKGRSFYDPNVTPDMNLSKEAYKNSTAPTINHFYEKLLLLKDRMHTPTAKKLAESRHAFLLTYLKQFFEEWEGKA
ncbi:MAG: HD domain-containing protein [Chitinophagaceae bacterium]|jgi:uncharacterized protein|nr:HD domain-containing protein [Chitinophagaceae bacterium]